MMKTLRLLLLSSLLVILGACKVNSSNRVTSADEKQEPVTKQIANVAFDKLDISSFFNVTFRRSDTYAVKITIAPKWEEYLLAEVENRKLKVGFKDHPLRLNKNQRSSDAVLEISAPSFKKMELSGAVQMELEGEWELENCMLDLSGAASMEAPSLRAQNLEIDLSGAANLNAKVQAHWVEAEVSGASHLNLEALNLEPVAKIDLEVSGASKANLQSLPSQTVKADVSGASHTIVYPLQDLKAESSGASSLRYVGSSKNLQKDLYKSGASSIDAL